MNVTFIHKLFGWMQIRVETDTVCIQICATATFPPFKELYTWLGRIRDRQLPVKMMIEEEGHGSYLIAKQLENETVEFSIEAWKYNSPYDVYLKTEIEADVLIKLFHNEIVSFIEKQSKEQEPSFIVGYDYLNWDALLDRNSLIQDWDKRLAIYGGAEGRYQETNIHNFKLTLEQEYLVKLIDDLSNFYRLSSFYNRKQLGELVRLHQELSIDIALGTIDRNWYEKKKEALEEKYNFDSYLKPKNGREIQEQNRKKYNLRQARLNTLEIGQVVDGSVIGIRPYGVFVDIGGIATLLYIKNISKLPIESPKQIFKSSDWVRAIIIDINFEKGRVSLSTKDLESEPGQMLKDPIVVYQNAEAMAAKYKNY